MTFQRQIEMLNNQIQHHLKIDISFDEVVFYDIEPKFRADFSGFDMSALFYGMEDKEYDKDVPSSFGKK